jgi:hypothetical protein
MQRFGPPLAVIGLAFFLLLLACALPALVMSRGGGAEESWPGIQVLGLGWMGPLIGQLGWYANLPAGLALPFLLFRRCFIAAGILAVSLLLSLHTLALFHQEIPANEGGVGPPYVLQRLGPGFYLWVASLLVLFLGSLALGVQERRKG